MASGNYSVASEYSSVASGAKANAQHFGAFVSGYRCTSGTYFQTVIGRTNVPTSDAFIIGNGSSDQVSDANAIQSNCFAVDWSGNVTAKYFSGYANAIGGEGIKVYATNSNEINFGGTSSTTTIYFGYRSMDSRPTPTTYKFGANGTAKLLGSADMLDGYHETKFFRHRGAANSTSISFPPTSSDLANITGIGSYVVQHSGHSSHLLNFNCEGGSTQYIQFLADYGNRLLFRCSTDSNLGQPWKKIAFTDSSITGNSASATKLQTARSLWGKSFDGSGNIDGSITLSTAQNAVQQSRGIKNTSSSGFIGYTDKEAAVGPDGEVIGESYNGISLGWGKNPETDAASVRINNSIFTYKSYPILHSNNFSDYAPTKTGGGASGTWGISISGNAATATKLGASSVGSATQPIYLNGGTPTACTYTLGKSVPSNAVFTDTTYSVATASADGLMSAAMFKEKMVKSLGIKQGEKIVNNITGEEIVTDHTIWITNKHSNLSGSVSSIQNKIEIPIATSELNGSMSYTDKRKLDNVHNNCVAASVYVLNLSYDFTNLNGLTLKMTDFLGLSAAIASGNRPDMIRLVTNFTTHIFTLYDSTNVINDGSFFYYRCDGKNAEISIENDEITFSVN